ncbi:hypothetical protein C8R45DRAFT_913850, partial [Mycena sanguinolenta]
MGNGFGRGNAHGSGNGNGGSTAPRSRGGGGSKGGVRHREREKDRDRVDIVVSTEDGEGEAGDEIRCRCGSSLDDGFSIACDVCGRWCHAACFGISKESVPEEWACWVCVRKGQVAILFYISSLHHTNGHKSRRRASISNRRSTTQEPSPQLLVDELYEDERTQYVQIEDDVVPHAATQRKLRAYAAHWRGVSALAPPSANLALGEEHTPFVFRNPPAPHPTALHPCPPFASSSTSPYLSSLPFPSSSSSTSASARPPTYALHTLAPAPPHTLLAPYPSLITPSSQYLAHPPNGYAHLGAPRRFVHIVGRPLDVALDARGVGGRGRWVRSGCWPNAEVRAYVCARGGSGVDGRKREGEGKGGGDDDEPRTHFGIFATRALKQGEEIVVGWEWDDGNAVH